MSYPWFACYSADILRDTAHLPLEQIGALCVALFNIYATDKSLCADRESLYRCCRAFTESERNAVDIVLEKYFYVETDTNGKSIGFRNARADIELRKRAETHKKQSESGGRGARKSWEGRRKNKILPFDSGANGQPNGHASSHPIGEASGQPNGHASSHPIGEASGQPNGHASSHLIGGASGQPNGHALARSQPQSQTQSKTESESKTEKAAPCLDHAMYTPISVEIPVENEDPQFSKILDGRPATSHPTATPSLGLIANLANSKTPSHGHCPRTPLEAELYDGVYRKGISNAYFDLREQLTCSPKFSPAKT